MKIECEAKELRSALEVARQVSVRPVNMRFGTSMRFDFATIEAHDGKIVMLMSDGEVIAQRVVAGDVQSSGMALLPIKKGLAFVRGEKGRVELSVIGKDETTLAGVGNGRSGLRLAVNEKNAICLYDHGEAGIALGEDFARRLSWVQTVTAKEEARPVLTTVLLRLSKDGLAMVAADGFRLMRVKNRNVRWNGEDKQLLLSRKMCLLASRYMRGDVKLGFNEERVVWLESDGLRIVSTMLSTQFPQYEQLFSTGEPMWKFTVSAPMLEARLRQFEPQNSIVRLQQSKEFVKVLMKDDEDLFETLILSKVESERGDCRVAVNKYFAGDAIRGFAEVTCEVSFPSSPIKVYGDVDGVEVVIMPMSVEW